MYTETLCDKWNWKKYVNSELFKILKGIIIHSEVTGNNGFLSCLLTCKIV